jgi:hypothetical protein
MISTFSCLSNMFNFRYEDVGGGVNIRDKCDPQPVQGREVNFGYKLFVKNISSVLNQRTGVQ